MPLYRSGRRRRHGSGEERSRSPCREDKEHAADPASTQTPLAAASSQGEEGDQASQLSGHCLPTSPVSRIWERLLRDWGRTFCTRLDLEGCFHTYPDVGGPFQSLLEIDEAIDRYLEDRRDPKMCVEQDKVIRECLYWPDGTIKKCTRSAITERSHNRMCQIVQALVDKYNEDHNHMEDRAHKLKDLLHYNSICENKTWYYHLNFTTKIKGAGPNECSMDNLFFVEVKCVPQGKHSELLVNGLKGVLFRGTHWLRQWASLQRHEDLKDQMISVAHHIETSAMEFFGSHVNPDDNGHCYGCTRNGGVGMKHPNSSVSYTAGHLNVGLPFGCFAKWREYKDEDDDDKYVKARAELRQMFKGLDNPDVMKKLCTLPPWATKRKALE